LLLYIFATIATVALVLERLIPVRPQPFLRRGLVTDGLYVVVNIALRVAFTGTIAMAIEDAGRDVVPAEVVAVLRDDPLWLQAIAVIVVLDLFFYWMHRAKHRFDWWWRLHETHHSSRDLDWFSSVRFHPLEKILDRSIYLAPLLFLGVSEQALLILAGLDAVVATISHANVRLGFGPLIYVFVGPEMHRLHHARAATAQRCNFGNNLSIFDWLFGTAVLPDTLPEAFGLEDEAYPEGNIVRQFFHAFRRFPAARSLDSNASMPA
jgi:sterol desaturase/sphingolipid hydroxylase (fatty acid hydroxylase superfamily)